MFVTAPKSLSFPAVQIATGATVAPGETVEVPDEVGVSLIDQGWTEPRSVRARRVRVRGGVRGATKTAAKKAAPKTEVAPAADDKEGA